MSDFRVLPFEIRFALILYFDYRATHIFSHVIGDHIVHHFFRFGGYAEALMISGNRNVPGKVDYFVAWNGLHYQQSRYHSHRNLHSSKSHHVGVIQTRKGVV
ncbi:MAG TPA: hypothetical protein VFB63_31060 [Bryobacteraceae bacterium]|nr:hypothetical protein [Bryobacteraceae bacterium]